MSKLKWGLAVHVVGIEDLNQPWRLDQPPEPEPTPAPLTLSET
jgi:hypothetical protein